MNSQQMKAFCFRSGLLQMATTAPDNVIVLAEAPEEIMVEAIFESAYWDTENDGNWFVPGVQKAETDNAALDCVFEYKRQLNKHISRALSGNPQAKAELELAFIQQQGGRHVCAASS